MLVLLGGLGVWLAWRPAQPLVDGGVDGGSGEPEAASPSAPATTTRASRDLPEVVVRVAERARLLELAPPPRCRVLAGEASSAARVSWLAGAAALPRPERATGPQLVAVDLPHAERSYHVVRVAGDGAELELDLGTPRSFTGRVVDAAGDAVAGARVWMGGRPEALTDAEGVFTVDGVRGRFGVPLVIRAAGHADHFRAVDLDGSAAPPVYALTPGVELIVRIAAPRPSGAARVCLRPAGNGVETVDLSLRHYPLFWPVIAGAPEIDAEGACRLTGLPRGARVEVVVHHDAWAGSPPVAVDLRDDTQTVTVQPMPAPVVRGAIARDGVPVAGVLVVCAAGVHAPALPRSDELLAPDAALAGVAHAFSDAEGAFAVARPASASAFVLAVLPAGALGLERRIDQAAGAEVQRFELPRDEALSAPGKPALRLRSERALRVIVERGASRQPAAEIAAGGELLVPLAAPACVDVEVRAPDGTRTERALAVRGAVEVWL
jgi:hypothetical protein